MLRPALDAEGVKIVTLSTATSRKIRMGHRVHGLKATMLADPKLKVVEQFGYGNKNINNFKTPRRLGLPVPTTLLVDSEGKVVWNDQTDNYVRRSDPQVIGAALAEHFA